MGEVPTGIGNVMQVGSFVLLHSRSSNRKISGTHQSLRRDRHLEAAVDRGSPTWVQRSTGSTASNVREIQDSIWSRSWVRVGTQQVQPRAGRSFQEKWNWPDCFVSPQLSDFHVGISSHLISFSFLFPASRPTTTGTFRRSCESGLEHQCPAQHESWSAKLLG